MTESPLLFLLAGALGYLAGAISCARIVTAIVAPGQGVSRIAEERDYLDGAYESDTVSATTVRFQLGARYGCLTGILDMLKVIVPTLAFRLLFPDAHYHLVAAAMAVVGHNWPVYYRFEGGRGETAMLGGLLAIDPLGVVVTNIAGMAIGALIGNIIILRWSGMVLMIPWLWLRTGDWAYPVYMVFIFGVYLIALRPDLEQYAKFRRQKEAPTQEDIAEFLAMGRRLGRFMDRYSLLALIRHMRSKG